MEVDEAESSLRDREDDSVGRDGEGSGFADGEEGSVDDGLEDGFGAWEESVEVDDHREGVDVYDAAFRNKSKVVEREARDSSDYPLRCFEPDPRRVDVSSDRDS